MTYLDTAIEGEQYDRTYLNRVLVKRVLKYFYAGRRDVTAIVVAVLVTACGEAVVPVLLSWGLDKMIEGGGSRTTFVIACALLFTGVLTWTLNLINQTLSARVVNDMILHVRSDVFKSILHQDRTFFDTNSTGRIVSRITSDAEDFTSVVTLILGLISQSIMLLILTAVLFERSVGMTLVTLTIVPVIVVIARVFRSIARRSTQSAQRALARLNSNVQEMMDGITVAKNFRREAKSFHDFCAVNREHYTLSLRQGRVFASIYPTLFLGSGLATVFLLQTGGTSVLENRLTVGEWYLFLQTVTIFWSPLTSVSSFWSQFQQGLSAAERVFSIMDAPKHLQQLGNHRIESARGEINYRSVTFGYSPTRRVLRDFNLHIDPGETVALVGSTGAGKSTLGKLLMRSYELDAGRILVDGHDIRTLDLSEYRRSIGVVPQLPFLFSGSVQDNLRYVDPSASDVDVLTAAMRVGRGEWLEGLSRGLSTEVGEFGKSLSMGQRQLVALTRVLIRNPPILILDEATASVDPLTEHQIQEGLNEVLKDRTALLIAHRLPTVKRADRIIVIQAGEIVEEGSHRSLIKRGQQYAAIYNKYFRHQSASYQPRRRI